MEPEVIIALLIIGLLLAIYILYRLFSFIKLVSKRLALVSKIKSLCKQNGVRCEIRSALSSLFKRGGREDIAIEKNGKWYDIYVLSSRFTSCRYHITPEYVQLYKKATVIAPTEKNGVATHGFKSVYEKRWRVLKSFYIEDYGDNGKVLLVCPSPDQITVDKDGDTVALINGDTAYGKVVYYSESGISRLIAK